jgi:hypothetical protein
MFKYYLHEPQLQRVNNKYSNLMLHSLIKCALDIVLNQSTDDSQYKLFPVTDGVTLSWKYVDTYGDTASGYINFIRRKRTKIIQFCEKKVEKPKHLEPVTSIKIELDFRI